MQPLPFMQGLVVVKVWRRTNTCAEITVVVVIERYGALSGGGGCVIVLLTLHSEIASLRLRTAGAVLLVCTEGKDDMTTSTASHFLSLLNAIDGCCIKYW